MADACGWDVIHAWVQEHRESLPTTLAALSDYPLPYRAAIQAAVAPEIRVSLWREHFVSFLIPASTLSAPQQEFLRETLLDLPAIFASDKQTGQARARELELRMAGVFTRQEAGRIFAQLGPDEPGGGLRPPL
jgi:hypothetical protein